MENLDIAVVVLIAYAIVTFAIMVGSMLQWSIKHDRLNARDFFLAPIWPFQVLRLIFKGLVGFIRAIPRMYRDAWK